MTSPKYKRDWYAKNKERIKARCDKRLRENPALAVARKAYQKMQHLKKKFGMSLEDFQALFVSQGSCCAICKSAEPRGGRWVVDHCHLTEEVRGIICRQCNSAIGMLNDDITLLELAINYLRRHHAERKTRQSW